MIKNELDILRDVTERLEAAGIAFMLTGSLAMNYFAEPRMTRNIDLVIDINETQVTEICCLFEGDYYIDQTAVFNAIASRAIFNLIHNETIIKVDCIVLKRDAYREEEFGRRTKISMGDFQTWIVSREDLILSKLYWARDSKSEFQFRDVRNLLTSNCDLDYLESRSQTLGVYSLLKEVLQSNE